MNPNRFPLRLLATLFLAIPLVLGFFNDRMSQEVARQKAGQNALQLARRMAGSYLRAHTTQSQITQLLQDFQIRLQPILQSHLRADAVPHIRALYKRLLARRLPPHDLVVTFFDQFRQRPVPIFRHDGGLGFVGRVAGKFLDGAIKEYLNPVEMAELSRAFGDILKFPVTQEIFQLNYSAILGVMTSQEGRRGFFWSSIPRQFSSSNRILGQLAVVVDLSRVPVDYPNRLLVSRWSTRSCGIGFTPRRGGRLTLSQFFRGWPTLVATLPGLLNAYPDHEINEVVDEVQVLSPAPAPGQVFRYLVAVPLDTGESGSLAARYPWFTWQVLGWSLLLALAWLETRMFGKPLRLPVGLVLAGAFLLVVLIPGAGVLGIGQFVAAEREIRDRQNTARQLHQRMTALEAQVTALQSATIRGMRRVTRRRETLDRLRDTAKSATETKALQAIAGDLFTVAPEIRNRWNRNEFTGILLANGPDEFCRSWIQSYQARNTTGGQANLVQLLLPFTQRSWTIWQRRFASESASITPDLREDRIQMRALRNEMVFEDVRTLMATMFGSATFIDLLFFPNRLVELKMNIGRLFIINTLVLAAKEPAFLLTWLWDEQILRGAFSERIRYLIDPTWTGQIFLSNLDTPSATSDPPGIEEYHDLFSLVAQSQEGMQVRRRVRQTPTGDVLCETFPSRKVSNILLAGRQVVPNPAPRIKRLFLSAVGVGFTVALALALAATLFFVTPLRGILDALRRYVPGRPIDPLPEEGRNDEFGTLAGAFRTMAEGLRQKELLTRFVSRTVQRLVTDPEFRRRAQEGESRKVTILFCGLLAFDELQAETPPETVFKWMEGHWAHLHAVVEELGGEVNKVMGEKILVVFDHEQLGDKGAAAAALGVATTLHRRLAESGLPTPIMGLNSGPVIAGLMGSPTFRLDYTVIGDTVNLASRLATLANTVGGSRVVVSGNLLPDLPAGTPLEKLPFTRVKGKTQEVEAYLLGLSPEGGAAR